MGRPVDVQVARLNGPGDDPVLARPLCEPARRLHREHEVALVDRRRALDVRPRGVVGGEGEAGDPMTPRLRWTSKSLENLSDELSEQGHEASPTKVRGLMREAGWRLQSNNKSVEKLVPHEDRDPQFRYINSLVSMFAGAGLPVSASTPRRKNWPGTSPAAAGNGPGPGRRPSRQDHYSCCTPTGSWSVGASRLTSASAG